MDKRDANEKEIARFLERVGCEVIRQDRHAGFDLLVIAPAGIYVCEVKNPARAWTLTDAEKEMQARIEQIGQKYNIIETVEDAAKLVGL
jgi:Holliday junction resolvase